MVVVTVSELGKCMGSAKGGGVGRAGCEADPRRCRFTSVAFMSLLRLEKLKKFLKHFFSFLNISSDLITVTLADILRKL